MKHAFLLMMFAIASFILLVLGDIVIRNHQNKANVGSVAYCRKVVQNYEDNPAIKTNAADKACLRNQCEQVKASINCAKLFP